MLTTAQIAWASKHDWFIGANGPLGSVRVRNIECDIHGQLVVDQIRVFNDFQSLRIWAGY